MMGVAPVLLSIVVFSVVLAGAYLFLGRGSALAARLLTKAGSVFLLALAAWISDAPFLLVLALVFSGLGDMALVFAGRGAFLVGLAAFLMAHLLFSAVILSVFGWSRGHVETWQVLSILLFGLGAAGLLTSVWDGARGMRIPATTYAAAILAMTLLAVMTSNVILLAGAALFFLSDAVLSLETFRLAPDAPIRRLTAPVVWITYFTAQLLLAYAIAASADQGRVVLSSPGDQAGGAISNASKEKPGETVQPTRV